VDLEKGLLEGIQLNLDSWSYIQQVDYEQIPFKCKICHEYGHFAKSCPQAKDTQDQDPKKNQWQHPKRKKPNGKTQQTCTKIKGKSLLSQKKRSLDPLKRENQATTDLLVSTKVIFYLKTRNPRNKSVGKDQKRKKEELTWPRQRIKKYWN
jgi:hypothetical protein